MNVLRNVLDWILVVVRTVSCLLKNAYTDVKQDENAPAVIRLHGKKFRNLQNQKIRQCYGFTGLSYDQLNND